MKKPSPESRERFFWVDLIDLDKWHYLSFSFDDFFNCVNNVLRSQSILLQQLRGLTTFPERIVHRHHLNRRGIESRKDLGYTITKTTIDLVLFAGNNTTCLRNRCKYRFDIEWLDCVHVDELDTDAFVGQFFFGLNCLPYHVATGNDRYVFTFDHL